MVKHNPSNERIKRQYLIFLREARKHSEASLDSIASALHRFEEAARFRDFRTFRPEQAVAFKKQLREQISERSQKPLSEATIYSTLIALRNFFQWLAGQPGFRSRLTYSDADYFNPSEKGSRIATARREVAAPTVEQVRDVIRRMPASTEMERRDRAIVAFALLTGARDGAIASFRLKHVDLHEGRVDQDAREVRTKFSKTFTTYFFPVGDDVRAIVADWVEYLLRERQFSPDDPLFPATSVQPDANQRFAAVGVGREPWANATPIRNIFREAFARAGLPYCNPHRLRTTLARFGGQVCRTPEEYKAWSQNLGHEQVLTTFSSYGSVPRGRQQEIIRDLSMPRSKDEQLQAVLGELMARMQHAMKAT